MKLRLDKALQSQGLGSRRAMRAAVEAGEVRVNGARVDDPDGEVDTAGLVLSLRGSDWPFRERLFLLLNKPAGVECSHTPSHHPSVFSLLPEPFVARGVQCVGRLDADTTGLLLLSDDGHFVQRLTSPRHLVAKTYLVGCAAVVSPAQVEALVTGVQLNDEAALARGAVEAAGERALRLTITEGRYHQVKRMLAAVGNHVVSLHRERLGAVTLGDGLAPGRWRELTLDELEQLRSGT